ncbi:unnamed protein product [Mytilus edulis]|uniref:Uncharacterized protein n=1 Tax=Mytilus edulis TaxID=6550 RepID=A0A8S3S6U8_MYTED|nr:unnamed protein product [Mytilus edulis]
MRPNTEWYTDELRLAKRDRRKAERRMRKSNLTVHRQIFQDTCLKASKLLLKSKKDYFSTKISDIEHDQKQLHRLTNDLMGNRREIILPSHKDEKVLADKFCSSYTYIGVIISGMAASVTLITSFTALRRFINTASTIRHSDLTEIEHNISSNDGIDVIRALNCNGHIDKEYNNIPPKSHMNPSNDGIGVITALNCNGQMNNEYNNIPPKRALNCNGQMDKEYNNIPPKSHMTLSSFSNIPYTHHLMVFERNSTSGKSDITFVEASEL